LRQGEVLQDRQPLEALLSFSGEHCGAVVAEHSTRQAALLERLAQAVDEGLGVLWIEVPLGVAAEAGVIVEDAEQDGALPLAAR
jgi:hypothetical protein